MKRRLVTLAAAASLLLCITTVALWIGTLGREVNVYRWQVMQQTLRTDWFAAGRGELVWSSNTLAVAGAHHTSGYVWNAEHGWEDARAFLSYGPGLRRVGFDLKSGNTGRTRWRILAVPCWFVALALGMLPASKGLSLYRCHKRIAEGRCRTCGYDLRATPDRCPECGTVPAPVG